MTDDAHHLRLGDADRSVALDALTTNFVEGRLTKDEFDERSSAVVAATIYADLVPVFDGLPGGVPLQPTSDGTFQPRNRAQVVPIDEDKELRTIMRKGRVMDRVDSVAWSLAALIFFGSMFVFHIPNAWLAWIGALAVTLIGRGVLGYNDSDEKAYAQIKETAERERAERLQIALERRRELDR